MHYKFLKKVIHQVDTKWKSTSFNKFYRKYQLVFVWAQENASSYRFYFKVKRKTLRFPQKLY